MPQIHAILNNAYILFCLVMGFWSTVQAARNRPLGGQFWGALATGSILAGGVLLWALVMALAGIQAHRWVYYLYAVYFVIVFPGTFTLLHGRDDRTAALIYGIVAFFSAGAALRTPLLTQPWIMP